EITVFGIQQRGSGASMSRDIRLHAQVPAMTFSHLTLTLSAITLWDVSVGRFGQVLPVRPRQSYACPRAIAHDQDVNPTKVRIATSCSVRSLLGLRRGTLHDSCR